MFAHVKKNANGQWEIQSIKEHLDNTANKAKDFAYLFGNQDWAELAGFFSLTVYTAGEKLFFQWEEVRK